MSGALSKVKVLIYLLIIVSYFFVSFNTYKDEKIHLGGDNVAYYLLAKSLSEGKGYNNNHIVGKKDGVIVESVAHTHFPPGFPAVMAPFMTVFGSDIATAKNINGFFLLLSSIVLFFLLKALKLGDNLSLISSLFLLHNYYVLYFSMYLYSEIAFMLFLLLFLLFFIKQMEVKDFWKSPYFYLSIFSMVVMFYIKSLAIGVITAMLLFLLIKRKWKRSFIYIGALILFYAPWMVRMSKLPHTSYLTYLSYKDPYNKELGTMDFSDLLSRVFLNFKRYLSVEVPDGMLPMKPLYNYQSDPGLMSWIIGGGIVLFVLYGVFRLKKYSLLLFLAIGAIFSILLLWPEVWFGKRFYLPLIPLLYGMFFWGVYKVVTDLLGKTKYRANAFVNNFGVFAFLLLFLPSKIGTKILKQNVEAEFAPKYWNYFEAAKWIKVNTADSSVAACRKPHLFHVYSEKKVTSYLKSPDKEAVLNHLREYKATHVIVESLGFSSTSKYLVPMLMKYSGKFKEVYKTKKPEAYVFEFHSDKGYEGEWKGDKKDGEGKFIYFDGSVYSGEWKNNLRDGKGEFVWANKTKYEGEWKSNFRNGKGVLYMPNGNVITTSWVNDKMEGDGIIHNVKTKESVRGVFSNNNFVSNRK